MSYKREILILLAALLAAPLFGQSAAELLERGREAYLNYDFEAASRDYAAAKRKGKKGDTAFTEKYNLYHHQLTDAENFLERVEQIVIIDSICVPRDAFFKAYRLPASAGVLRGSEALPYPAEDVEYVFTNERGDYKVWAQADVDSTGYYRMMESSLLGDGKWSTPAILGEDLAEDCDAIFPFMMSDGVTLYYADNGENSIGGYDIMVATRDAADGSFLQPQNLGFPYNSPYDDYLLAIDELNGVGWWATDRNQLDDEITIYLFITNDLRKNYPVDTEDLVSYARIDDYIATQPEDADYDSLLNTIRNIDPTASLKAHDFEFPIDNGVVLTSYDDLRSNTQKSAMRSYQKHKEELAELENSLSEQRREYHESGNKKLGASIASLEKRVESSREALKKELSDLYKIMR